MMGRGRLKTIILIGLILNCFFLSYMIWFSDSTQRYQISSIGAENAIFRKITSFFRRDSAVQGNYKEAFRPFRIIVNRGGGNREFYEMSNTKYNDLLVECEQHLKNLFQSYNVNFITINQEDWEEIIRSRSIFVDFDSYMGASTIGQLSGVLTSTTYEQLQKIKEVVLLPGDNITKDISFVIKDYKSGTVYKYFIPADKSALNNLIERYAPADKTKQSPVSFDLVRYKPDISRNVLIKPFVYIEHEVKESFVIRAVNPLIIKGEDTLDLYKIRDNVAKCFDYNTNTIQKYRDKNDAIVFVDTYSTLKVNKNGVLEYTVSDEKRGLPLTASGSSLIESASQVYQLIESIYQSIGQNVPKMRFMNDMDATDTGDMDFALDYLMNGTIITADINNPDGSKLLNHFAEASIKNGKLTSFKLNLKIYEFTDKTTSNISFSEALEIFSAQVHNRTIWIDGAYLGYVDNGNQEELNTGWNIKTNNIYRAIKP